MEDGLMGNESFSMKNHWLPYKNGLNDDVMWLMRKTRIPKKDESMEDGLMGNESFSMKNYWLSYQNGLNDDVMWLMRKTRIPK